MDKPLFKFRLNNELTIEAILNGSATHYEARKHPTNPNIIVVWWEENGEWLHTNYRKDDVDKKVFEMIWIPIQE